MNPNAITRFRESKQFKNHADKTANHLTCMSFHGSLNYPDDGLTRAVLLSGGLHRAVDALIGSDSRKRLAISDDNSVIMLELYSVDYQLIRRDSLFNYPADIIAEVENELLSAQ